MSHSVAYNITLCYQLTKYIPVLRIQLLLLYNIKLFCHEHTLLNTNYLELILIYIDMFLNAFVRFNDDILMIVRNLILTSWILMI